MLSEAQKKAVCHKDGPCLALAGPGAGKTLVLTRRISHLIREESIPPEQILVITFSKAAATEMRERFYSLMGERVPVTFGTFHSVFYAFLRKSGGYAKTRLLYGNEKRRLLKETIYQCIAKEPEGISEKRLEQEISYVKNTMLSPEKFSEKSDFGKDFSRLFGEYESRKEQNGCIDFDDMLTKTLQMLDADERITAYWQKRFPYLLVDEAQDMNPLQFEIIRRLALPHNNLYLVGDDDQSIYGFRGATPSMILNFQTYYPNASILCMGDNYRCGKKITEASLSLIKHNKMRREKHICAKSQTEGNVIFAEVENAADTSTYTANAIQKSYAGGMPYESMAILFRNHMDCQSVVGELNRRKIPYFSVEDMENVYYDEIMLDIIAYLKVATGAMKQEYLLRIMNRPNRFLSRAGIDRKEITFASWKAYYRKQPWLFESVEQLERDIGFLKKLSGRSAVLYIRNKIGYDMYLKAQEENDAKRQRQEEIMALLTELATDTHTIGELIAKWERAAEGMEQLRKKQKDDKKQGVGLYTLHSAKGLEFQQVFILKCNEGTIPSAKATDEEKTEEERRLFYVGVTRAKETLHLLYEREDKKIPSRFLGEMQGESGRN